MPTLAPAAVGDYSGTMVRGDFNGDGKMDVAASSPEHDCGKGRVYVRLDGGSTTLWHRDTFGILGVAACNDNFGTSLAAADLNGDGRDDLIVGVPGANDPGQTNAGAMQVIYGSASGLTTTGDQLWHQNTTGIEGVSEVNDYLGDTLTVGDFNCDTYSDVVIGVPREAIGSNAEAGAVHVLYGSSGGLTSVNDIYYQGSGGVNGIAQAYDHFGAALAAGNIKGNQSSGVGCDDLTIGVPQEDIGTVTDAGYIYIAYGSASGLSTTGDQAFHQNVSGIVDTAQANDRFGERLEIVDVDRDGYGDIRVTVPGDGCVGPTGWGRHTLFGSATGIVTAGNAMDCDTFRCGVHDDDLSCTGGHPPVYGSTSDNRIAFLYGNDVAYGGSGNDELYGSHGGDVFIGGPGNDTLDGGPDIDILIGGSGNDAFIIDMDCEVEPGDIVDGGGGTDTVYSHRSQGELTTMGVTFVSIEQFVVIEHDSDTVKCEPFPYDGGPIWQPRVKLTWDDVPTPATVTTTTSGILHLSVLNTGSTAVTAEIGLRLWARGFSSPLLIDPVNLAASGSSGDRDSIEIDLNDFIPGGTDLQSVDPAWLELPVSARLYAVARVKTATGAGVAETPKAMPLFGHLEGSTAVIYGPAALQEIYNGGDLAHITSVPQPASVFRGAIEAHGSLAVQ